MMSEAPRELLGREGWTGNALGLLPEGQMGWFHIFDNLPCILMSPKTSHTYSEVAILPMHQSYWQIFSC